MRLLFLHSHLSGHKLDWGHGHTGCPNEVSIPHYPTTPWKFELISQGPLLHRSANERKKERVASVLLLTWRHFLPNYIISRNLKQFHTTYSLFITPCMHTHSTWINSGTHINNFTYIAVRHLVHLLVGSRPVWKSQVFVSRLRKFLQ